MGITNYNFNRMKKYLPTDSLCELGDQWLFVDGIPHHTFARDVFKDVVSRYESIDYEDRDSVSLVLDLSKDINSQENYDKSKYDVVTDFGTMEHVVDYYQGFKNAYNLCKTGGVIITANPKINNWPGHGFHTFSVSFFEELAKLTEMEILFIEEYPACGNYTDGWEVCTELRKTKEEFPTREEFNQKLSNLYESKIENNSAASQIGLTEQDVNTILEFNNER